MEKLMNYDFQPFKPGDVVECISDGCQWIDEDSIKVGDRLIVDKCNDVGVRFLGKKFIHDVKHFAIIERVDAVEPEYFEESATPSDLPPSDRLESALKFLETSGDVFQALKIAAGVR